jgi:hypothetical protein
VFVSLEWQALGAWPSRAEILQGCADLGDCGLVEIINVCGSPPLGLIPQRSCSSEGWEFEVVQPWRGRGSGPEDWRSHGGMCSSSSADLWSGTQCAAPAILVVYGGVERAPTS